MLLNGLIASMLRASQTATVNDLMLIARYLYGERLKLLSNCHFLGGSDFLVLFTYTITLSFGIVKVL